MHVVDPLSITLCLTKRRILLDTAVYVHSAHSLIHISLGLGLYCNLIIVTIQLYAKFLFENHKEILAIS